MLALSGAAGPSVLQVRCLNVLPEAIGPLVLGVLRTYAAEIEQGALVVADERRERVRILPLSRQGFLARQPLQMATARSTSPGAEQAARVVREQVLQEAAAA